jgi:hypothetical protein
VENVGKIVNHGCLVVTGLSAISFLRRCPIDEKKPIRSLKHCAAKTDRVESGTSDRVESGTSRKFFLLH